MEQKQKPSDGSSLPGPFRRCAEILKSTIRTQKDAVAALRKASLPSTLTLEQLGALTQALPQVFSALFDGSIGLLPKDSSKDDSGTEVGLRPVEIEDLGSFVTVLAERLSRPPANLGDVELSIGLGGSENVPNIRIAAYILPALRSLAALEKLRHEKGIIGALPELLVFKADHIAHAVNQFDPNQLARVTQVTFLFLKMFAESFFPDVAARVHFAIDKDPLSDADLMSHLRASEAILAKHTENPAVRSIIEMGRKYGGNAGINGALLYASAHAHFPGLIPNGERDLVPVVIRDGALHNDGTLRAPSLVITYGGRSQNVFNQAARVLMDDFDHSGGTRPPAVGLILAAGKVPPYYPARQGDIPLGADFDGDVSMVDPHTRPDYAQLFSVIPRDEFVVFLQRFNAEYHSLIDEIAAFRSTSRI